MKKSGGDSYYDTMQVCLNGHRITDKYGTNPNYGKSFCDKCGAKTITKCPECGENIRGYYHIPNVYIMFSTPVPGHCPECGTKYPWSRKASYRIRNVLDVIKECSKKAIGTPNGIAITIISIVVTSIGIYVGIQGLSNRDDNISSVKQGIIKQEQNQSVSVNVNIDKKILESNEQGFTIPLESEKDQDAKEIKKPERIGNDDVIPVKDNVVKQPTSGPAKSPSTNYENSKKQSIDTLICSPSAKVAHSRMRALSTG